MIRIIFRLIPFVTLFFSVSMLTACSGDDNDNGGEEQNNIKFYDDPFANIPEPADMVIYEANPRVFAPQNSINAITSRLDEIKLLGANVLWIMPVMEQGVEKSIRSPYCIKNFKKIGPEYGTLEDFRNLVKQAHDRGMAVILDWIANHTSWDNDWINNKSWYTQDVLGNIVSPQGTSWTDVADLNYDNADLRKAMIDAMKYWIIEANIDGFRCDAADMVPVSFWKETIDELRSLQSGRTVFMLAEGSNINNFSAGFDMDYGWNFYDVLLDLYNEKKSIAALYEVNKKEYDAIPKGKQKLRHITNHDKAAENSPVTLFKGQRGTLSAYALTCTLGGSPLIYSSQEIAYPNRLSFFSYQSINWNSNPDIYAEYKKITEAHNSLTALRKGQLQTFDDPDIACFYRLDGVQGVLVAVNTRNAVKTWNIPHQFAGLEWENMMDNTTISLPQSIEMQAYQYYIWKKKI